MTRSSSEAAALSEWVTAVARDLGLENAVTSGSIVDTILDLAADAAHGVSRPAAPVTAFLVGLAAGRQAEPAVALADYARRISALAEGWGSDAERGVSANEQSQRG